MADIVTLTAEGRFREAGLSTGIKNATKAVYELDTSLSALQNTMKNVTLAPAMQKVVASFKSAVAQIKDSNPLKMMDAWKQANKELQDITGVQTMKNAWELLENATTPERIMNSFNAIGSEFKRMASDFKESSAEASKSIDELINRFSSMQTMLRNLQIGLPMQKVVSDFKSEIAQITDNDPARKLEAWETAYRRLQNIMGDATIKNAWKDIDDASNPQKIMSSFEAIGKEYRRVANEAESSAARQQAALKEMYDVAFAKYDSHVADVDSSSAKATADAAKDIDTSMRGADTSISEASKSMQSLGSETTKTNGIFKNFMGSLTRIAKLRLLRGIIRAVTQAFKEGTENIYQYSAALGAADASHFKTTMDGLASSFLYLKNSIGSVVAPLLASLVPALQTVISWVSAALNVLAQFFAILNGQSTYTRAKQTATEWKNIGTAAGGAAAAAKEYKNTIMSFDEIHALNDVSDGGGGGGGGAGSPNYADMFEEAELATTGIAGAFNRLATAIKPVIGGIWDFTKNTVETAIEGMGLGFDALMAVIHGDADEIRKVVDDMGKFVSKHPVLKGIYDGINNVRRFINDVISEVKLWVLNLIEDFINLPFVSWILEKLGFDVGAITENLEKNKREIQANKDEVNRSIRVWQLWSSGVDMATANSIANINQFSIDGIKAFAGVQSAANTTKNSVNNVSGAVVDLNRSIAALGGMSISQWVENGLWGIYNSANYAKWELAGVLDYVRELSRASLNGIAIAVYGGVGRANGGFVNGYANGGIIPRFDGGGINSAQLFLANENGMPPELIGTIGNRTAVANQGQMVEAMAEGVYRAMSNVMSNGNSNTEVNVYMNDEVVARAADRGNRSLNRRFNVSLA